MNSSHEMTHSRLIQ